MATSQLAPDFALDGDRPPLIKSGVYDLKFLDWETRYLFGRAPKLVMRFSICSMGEYFGRITLPRHYNLARIMGKPAKFGRFKVGFKSDFLREYATMFPVPTRLDRVPMSVFENHIITGVVATVIRGADQRPIPEALQYSLIKQLRAARQA